MRATFRSSSALFAPRQTTPSDAQMTPAFLERGNRELSALQRVERGSGEMSVAHIMTDLVDAGSVLDVIGPQLAQAWARRWRTTMHQDIAREADGVSDLGRYGQSQVAGLIKAGRGGWLRTPSEQLAIAGAIVSAGSLTQVTRDFPTQMAPDILDMLPSKSLIQTACTLGRKLQTRLQREPASVQGKIRTALEQFCENSHQTMIRDDMTVSRRLSKASCTMELTLFHAGTASPSSMDWAHALASGSSSLTEGQSVADDRLVIADGGTLGFHQRTQWTMKWIDSQVQAGRARSVAHDPVLMHALCSLALGGKFLHHDEPLDGASHERACRLMGQVAAASVVA